MYIEEYLNKAEKGDVEAIFKIGVCFSNGIDVAQDYTRSAKWFELAADRGHMEAKSCLAWQYAVGYGIPQDLKKSFDLYLEAAEYGIASAQYWLAGLYMRGDEVVDVDYQKAMEWANKVHDKPGMQEAATNLVNICKTKLGL